MPFDQPCHSILFVRRQEPGVREEITQACPIALPGQQVIPLDDDQRNFPSHRNGTTDRLFEITPEDRDVDNLVIPGHEPFQDCLESQHIKSLRRTFDVSQPCSLQLQLREMKGIHPQQGSRVLPEFINELSRQSGFPGPWSADDGQHSSRARRHQRTSPGHQGVNIMSRNRELPPPGHRRSPSTMSAEARPSLPSMAPVMMATTSVMGVFLGSTMATRRPNLWM